MAKQGEEETTRSEEETPRSEEQTARSDEQAQIEELVGEKPTRGAMRRDWKLLPRVLPYLRPYRKFAVLSVLCTIVLAVVVLAEPWPIAFVIDSVLGSKEPPGWVTGIFGDGVGTMIALAVGATLLLTALSGGLTVVNEYLATTVDQRMVLDLRSEMFQHTQRLSLAFHDTERTGILMYRINQQASAVGRIVTGLPQIAQAVLTILGMAYITYRIDPLLALIALAVVPFIFYSTTFYTDRIEPRLYRVRGLEGLNLSIVHESMQMMRVVLAFGHEKREYGRFREQGEEAVDARIDLTVRQTAFKLGVQMITAAGTAAVLGIGAYRAINGHISPGELIVVLTYITQVYTPLEQLTSTIAAFQQEFIAVRHALDLLDTAPEVVEKPDARAVERVRGEIELENVSFDYQQAPRRLEGRLAPGARRGGRRAGRAHRRRQVDAGQPAAPLLQHLAGPGAARRDRHRRPEARLAARAVLDRPPGAVAVLGDDPREHPLREARREQRGGRGGRQAGERARVHHPAAGRLRDDARRARGEDLRR